MPNKMSRRDAFAVGILRRAGAIFIIVLIIGLILGVVLGKFVF